MKTKLKILLADDSPEFMDALGRFITKQPWAEIIGRASCGKQTVRLAEELEPDLVLMDLVMPELNGLEATRRIKQLPAPPRIIILTLHDNAEYRLHAKEAGADGYVPKAQLQSELIDLVQELYGSSFKRRNVKKLDGNDHDLARRALADSEERLRLALSAGSMGIFDWNIATGVITWSEEHAQLFGLRLEEFDGSYEAFARCVHPNDLPGIEASTARARANRDIYEQVFRIFHPDGKIRWISGKGRFHYDASGAAVRMIGVVTDITTFKETLEALQYSEAHLRAIIDAEPECVKVTKADGTLLQMNAAGLAMLEVDRPEEVVGKSIMPLIAPEYRQQFQAFTESVLRGNKATLEFEMVGLKGTRRWMEIHAVALHIASENAPLILGVTRDITERKGAEERLEQFSHYDALTGLPNRLLFLDRLEQAMIEARRHDRLVGIVLLDLDQFKKINDTMGYAAGDALIKVAGERLRANLRAGDTVARLGGDEFAIVLADIANIDDTTLVLQKIMGAFANPFDFEGRQLFMTASLGITIYPFDETDPQDLLRNADIAMYRGKELGRNSYQFYTPEMTAKAKENMAIESELRGAVERGELYLCYQPQVSLNSGAIFGVETLLRWNHPRLGIVPPAKFIPLAEETGLIVPIGEWVLRHACAQAKAWHAGGFSSLRLTVNLSSRQFQDGNFPETVSRILDETEFPAAFLDLELTESMLLKNVDETLVMLNQLNDLGVQFSVDDFGTGYSSLSYLKRLPIDVLKIDQSFVRDITTDIDDAAIVRAIITLAHSLSMQVIAEGVETREQLHFLLTNGCDAMQGYFFSEPQPAEDLMGILTDGKTLPLRRQPSKSPRKRS